MTRLPRTGPALLLAPLLLTPLLLMTAFAGELSPAAEQVARGNQVYEGNCGLCHGQGFVGGPGVPGLTGASFQFGWKDKPAAELFQLIKTSMPPGQEGSLSDQQVTDVMAAILAANKASVSSDAALPTDEAALKDKIIHF